jgi:hypothetical protein
VAAAESNKPAWWRACDEIGGGLGRNRTTDTRIFNVVDFDELARRCSGTSIGT